MNLDSIWLGIRDRRDRVWTYALIPVRAATVFVPLHFFTEGYMTAFSNILALWVFQLLVNVVVVVVAVAGQLGGANRNDDSQGVEVWSGRRQGISSRFNAPGASY